MTKQELRTAIQLKRSELELSGYLRMSKAVTDQVISEYFDKIKSVHVFIGMQNKREINTLPLIVEALKRGIEIWSPVIRPDKTMVHGPVKNIGDLSEGPFGLIQPQKGSTLPKMDLVLVPGLAFTPIGNRLGWGKGYYDGFLGKLSPKTGLAGLCFNFQVLPEIPVDPWDIKVNRIFTEVGLIQCPDSI